MTRMSLALDAGDLPPRLAQLAETIGLAATLRLVECRGGTKIYVPESATAEHWLARTIGVAALQKLVDAYRGDMLEIDRAAAAVRAARDREIIARYAAGESTATLALAFGLTQRQIFNILARVARPIDQADMFASG